MKYDVIIIGSGVSGAACARELSRYDLKICVLEKEDDVCSGTSKANSGIVHGGFDAQTGSLKAKLNVEGNKMMKELSEILDFPYVQNGSLVVANTEEDVPQLERLMKQGIANGVEGLEILNRGQLLEKEPNIAPEAIAALYVPTGGIVCPFNLNIAMAENAYTNDVEFQFGSPVLDIRKINSLQDEKTENSGYLYEIVTPTQTYETKCVINAAGVHADVIHNMVSKEKMSIICRKGEYCLLDKMAGHHVSHTVFSVPSKMGKGVLVTPTVHGNLLLGPTATDIQEKEGIKTTGDGLQEVLEKSGKHVVNIPVRQVITSFSGIRAHLEKDDFVIEEVADAPNFFDCAGIESPGLSASPAIGKMVAELVTARLQPAKKDNFIEKREGIKHFSECSIEEKNALIKKDPAYGNMICRCEQITEGEILDAIRRPLGAKSLDGIKRRTRAGMGRCQAGFCSPKTMEILSKERNIPMEEITKHGKGSNYIVGKNKDIF